MLTISLVLGSVFQTVGKMKMAFNIIENELFNIIYNFVFFCFEVQAVQVQVDFLGFLMFQVVFYEVYW